MSLLKRVLCTLLLLPISLAATGQQAPKNPSDSDVKRDAAKTISSLPKGLATDTQKTKLGVTVQKVIKYRIETNYRGYEDTPEFKEGFGEVQSKLQEFLKSSIPTPDKESVTFLLSESMGAYEKNEAEFGSFYDKLQKGDSKLQGTSKEEVLKIMFKFSALLYEKDPELWKKAFRITYLWPICTRKPEN